ncbi:hypothetical protein ACIBI9_06135 [Nonomuraea sp. NPDC050451]|uniref:hypothetical protein n=1 Tax=Nonomuraea sp. NPDC050451 TaxID=3364364 RepID=UPI003793923D
MFVAKAVAAALLATSFGGLATATPGTEAAYENKAKIESTRAACMKEQGLTYLPEKVIKRDRTKEERARLAGDHEALRAYRAKYGFGVWSRLVFPGDPAVDRDMGESRNNKLLMSLSAKDLKAWRAADDKCFAKAVKSVLGKTVTSQAGFLADVNSALAKGLRELDTDPKLAALGKEFGGCLKIAETRPTVLAARGRAKFAEEATEVARTQSKGSLPEGSAALPGLTPEQARPYLAKEVKAALADLECGKAFYPGYAPRARAIEERVYQEFALDFAL